VLLYSTNTWLALYLSSRFYGGVHWVYCTPVFALVAAAPHAPPQPPSSSPKNIYWELEKDVRAGDRHSSKIAQNRAGLKKGALSKHSAGLITDSDAADITWIVDHADIAQFRPLLYVIPRAGVAGRLKRVSPQSAASPFSDEYILEDLAIGEFEALELH
jgi:hypothetical protein